jgi:hypothetical protein
MISHYAEGLDTKAILPFRLRNNGEEKFFHREEVKDEFLAIGSSGNVVARAIAKEPWRSHIALTSLPSGSD